MRSLEQVRGWWKSTGSNREDSHWRNQGHAVNPWHSVKLYYRVTAGRLGANATDWKSVVRDVYLRLALAVLAYALLTSATAEAAEPRAVLKLGVAEIEITPPVGWRMHGSYHEVLNNGVHDPLMAKAFVAEQGETRMALVICDLCGITGTISVPIRQRVARDLGIPATNVAVCATHTHGGPLYDDLLRDIFRARVVKPGEPDPREPIDYQGQLVERCREVVKRAWESRRPARLGVVTAQQPGVVFNRRYVMKSGPVVTNPGKGNPNIVQPAGPIDPDYPVLFLLPEVSDAPFAAVSTLAMHVAVFGGTKYGADFPGHLQTELKKAYGPGFLSLMFEGCAGDTNHLNPQSKLPDPGAEEIGRRLAEVVAQSRSKAEIVNGPSLAVASKTVMTEYREAPGPLLERARLLFTPEYDTKAGFLERVEAYRHLLIEKLAKQSPDGFPMEVQAFRLDAETAIVTLPHEVFVELGLAIKADSPFRTTIVMSLANEMDFYVPTRKAYPEGGYEVTNSPVVAGSGELLVETAVELLKQLR